MIYDGSSISSQQFGCRNWQQPKAIRIARSPPRTSAVPEAGRGQGAEHERRSRPPLFALVRPNVHQGILAKQIREICFVFRIGGAILARIQREVIC